MLYTEFIDRVGRVRTEEEYHKQVEPEYYNFPGNKDEFCLQFIDREMECANIEYEESRRLLENAWINREDEQIEMFTNSVIMWGEIMRDFIEHRQALVKRIYNWK